MAKAYDRLEWDFLLQALKAFGFSTVFCNLIERMLNNCWFSIILNGSSVGYFKSTRGVRQGDPLAPSLFILAEEALSRGIDHLFRSGQLQYYQVPRGCIPISHLLYADDTLIFLNGSSNNVRKLLDFIRVYEHSSGQKVNINKSSFIVSQKSSPATICRLSTLSGFQHKTGISSYLGVPLYEGRKKICHFKYLLDRICSKLEGWKSKFLSQAGRVCLINSVLHSIPLYTASSICLPSSIISTICRICSNFFWSQTEERRRHWVSWQNITKPVEEGGLGIRNLKYMQLAMVTKQIWNITQGCSLWSRYARSRYLKGHLRSTNKPFPAGIRRDVFNKAKNLILDNTRWIPMDGKSIDLFKDNWYGEILDPQGQSPNISLWEARQNRDREFWLTVPRHSGELLDSLPLNTLEDKCIWSDTNDGRFSFKSAYNLLRNRGYRRQPLKKIWGQFIPPRVSLFCWRILHMAIPVDSSIKACGISGPSKCVCCPNRHQEESLNHLFLESQWAKDLWGHFSPLFPDQCRPSSNITIRCWDIIKAVKIDTPKGFASILTMLHIIWGIWKHRCKLKFEDRRMNTKILQQQISSQVSFSLKNKKFCKLPSSEDKRIMGFYDFSFAVSAKIPKLIKWFCPINGYALNVDGACKGNPGPAGGGGRMFEK